MALRNVVVTNPATETQRRLRRIVISQNAIESHWAVQNPDGSRKEHMVEASPALTATLFGNAPFHKIIDAIRDDTLNRVP